MIAKANGKDVVFEIPDEAECVGYSSATKARLDGRKLQSLGWRPAYDIEKGIKRTLEILSAVKGKR